MRLTRVVFDRFRKLDNINVRLDDVTIFIGENNAGKSTVLEGIVAAIFETQMHNSLRYFSKVTKENTSVKIFFKINDEDLVGIFHDLSLEYKEEDKALVYHEYELNCSLV